MDNLNDIISGLKWGKLDPVEAHDRVLALFSVSQRSELLGCPHNQIRIDGKDVGTCVKCGIKMEKTWQPNCA